MDIFVNFFLSRPYSKSILPNFIYQINFLSQNYSNLHDEHGDIIEMHQILVCCLEMCIYRHRV